jgi:hypothetical protein
LGVDLISQDGETFDLPNAAWALCLNLAEVYGWRPLGTLPPPEEDPAVWDGCYDASAGQTVTLDDAEAFAVAIRSARDDLERDAVVRQLARDLTDAIRQASGIASASVSAPEVAVLDKLLDSLLAFLRRGSFRIE